MGGFDMVLELVLVGLLGATLWQAVRLQRALGGLRRDRAAMDVAAAGFDSGVREVEAGLSGVREATERLAAQVKVAAAMRDELQFFSERGDGLVERLDGLLRAARALPGSEAPAVAGGWSLASGVEDEGWGDAAVKEGAGAGRAMEVEGGRGALAGFAGRLRSQAERHLAVALEGRR